MPFYVKILGSNSATPVFNRHHTAQVINIRDQLFLVDCGEGTQMQLRRYREKHKRIHHIFISHLHGDHYLGVYGLLSTMHLFGRTAELHLYGPKGLAEIITTQLKYSESVWKYPLVFHELDTEKVSLILENDILTVETIPLNHRIRCCGFLFREKPRPRRIIKEKLPQGLANHHLRSLKKGLDIQNDDGSIQVKNSDVTLPPKKSRSYAYCSDTCYHEPVLEQIQGVDLLYHEATFMNEMQERATQTFHSTTRDAATIAKKAGVGKLLIGHFSARYRDIIPFEEEAREIFQNTFVAKEGASFAIAEE